MEEGEAHVSSHASLGTGQKVQGGGGGVGRSISKCDG